MPRTLTKAVVAIGLIVIVASLANLFKPTDQPVISEKRQICIEHFASIGRTVRSLPRDQAHDFGVMSCDLVDSMTGKLVRR